MMHEGGGEGNIIFRRGGGGINIVFGPKCSPLGYAPIVFSKVTVPLVSSVVSVVPVNFAANMQFAQ
jgi:hypothetical protein